MPHEPQHNRRLTVALLAGAVVGPTVIGLVIGLLLQLVLPFVIVGLFVGVGLALAAWFLSPSWALRRAGAVAVPPAGAEPRRPGLERLENLVEGLCVASGLPQPALHLVDDVAPNAMASGVRRDAAAVVVTTGLLDTLGRVELEGVVAHLLARIRRDDIAPATLAGFLLGPLAAKVVHPDLLDADETAVSITRYPPGLAAALTKLRDDPRSVSRASRASLGLWVVPPAARTPDPDLDHRIAVLREL
jgi:heat shock protein HtpX